jgi:primase-polymerase (primpol)-like protein
MSIEERTVELAKLHAELFGVPKARAEITRPAPDKSAPSLADAEVINRAMSAVNGAKFRRLWAGDTSGYRHEGNDGHSEADLALCSLLAFWTGPDPERIDRLFRRSGLMRPKWDGRRGERTYGAVTIGEALRGPRGYYGNPPGSVRRVHVGGGEGSVPRLRPRRTVSETSEGASRITVEVA